MRYCILVGEVFEFCFSRVVVYKNELANNISRFSFLFFLVSSLLQFSVIVSIGIRAQDPSSRYRSPIFLVRYVWGPQTV